MTKALIVGGGIAGLSTAWALARRDLNRTARRLLGG